MIPVMKLELPFYEAPGATFAVAFLEDVKDRAEDMKHELQESLGDDGAALSAGRSRKMARAKLGPMDVWPYGAASGGSHESELSGISRKFVLILQVSTTDFACLFDACFHFACSAGVSWRYTLCIRAVYSSRLGFPRRFTTRRSTAV